MKRVLIQGAMDSELCYYKEQEWFQDAKRQDIHGFQFFVCQKGERILSNTQMGMLNASMATLTAIQAFEPDVILNQGTAGAQTPELRTGDIVLGERAIHINSLKMDKRDYGEGMSPQTWHKMNTEYLEADAKLLSFFKERTKSWQTTRKVVSGILGSGDLFSREKDRITWLHNKFDTISEDMESYAVYAACHACKIPCLALRIISNNELLDEDYQPQIALDLQQMICQVLEEMGGSYEK